MRLLISVSLALTCLSAPAFAGDAAKEKRICKRSEEGQTGTRLAGPTKVCRTAAEWKELEDNTERDLRRVLEGARIGDGTSSPAAGPSPQ